MKFKNLLFCITVFVFCGNAIGQSPGGVSTNLKLWVKSNTGTSTTTNGSPLDTWTYFNDGTKSFTGVGAARPLFSVNSINFLPGITFSGAQMMEGPNLVNAPINIR